MVVQRPDRWSNVCIGWHGKVQVKLHNHSTFKLIGQVFLISVKTGDQIKVRRKQK